MRNQTNLLRCIRSSLNTSC